MNPPFPMQRWLAAFQGILTPEVAEGLANLRLDAESAQRLEALAEKASEGTLTPAEAAEHREFVQAADFMAILQSQARQFLRERPTVS